jgi:hypothetical protein
MSVGWRPPLFLTQCVLYNLVRKNYDNAADLSIGDQAVEECVSAAFPQQLVLCHPTDYLLGSAFKPARARQDSGLGP